jgi:spore germination protein GerM
LADTTSQYLLGEERPGLGSDDPVVFCRQIIDALIQGPSSGLAPTIPPATEIRAIYIDDKTAYVDLTREVTASHPGGILSELMTIYSIVNTLVLNVDGVDQVKILIGGQEAETLSGHIDIRFPLNADMLLIK